MLDRGGAKRAVVLGCALAAVGFDLWAGKVTQLSFGSQRLDIILAGAGMGLMLGPAQTDAVNRASKFAYGEATGITQTIRNYVGSLGLAILGTILVSQLRCRITTSLIAQGLPGRQWACRLDPALRAAGLRVCNEHGVLRHGRNHGSGGARIPGRLARWSTRGSRPSSRR
jgi:hypothetical protein